MLSTMFFMGQVRIASAEEVAPLPPRGRNLTYEGTQYRCYTLDEYRQVAIDYVKHGELFTEVGKLQLTIQLLDIEKAAWQSSAEIGQEQVRSLQLTLDSDQDLRLREAETARKQRWVSLTGLLLAIAALGAVGVLEVVK
jgi:hypothetical protein